MQPAKPNTPNPPPAKKPAPDAVKMLSEVAKRAQAEQNKKKNTPPPDELPENWGVSDLVRVGKSRLKRAFYGPESDEKK
jgi:hypothetical protein